MKTATLIRELWKSAPGKLGLTLLGLLSLVSVYVILTYPSDYGTSRWGNPALWADNPKSVPPAWTGFLSSVKPTRHRIEEWEKPSEVVSLDFGHERIYRMVFALKGDEHPTFISFSLWNVEYHLRPPVITAVLSRPDGGRITLFRQAVSGPRTGEEAPYSRYRDEPLREVLGSDQRVKDQLTRFFSEKYLEDIDLDVVHSAPVMALFGVPGFDGGFPVLKGEYTLEVRILVNDERDKAGKVRMVQGGSVYGVMGTDALGRDLAEGLLFGLPVALLIGIATSTISTLLGMILGMVSGYAGGKTDLVIQRAADIVANIPVLPLLIFLVFIGGSKLWLILMVLVAFSWPGLTIMVRSMVLQLRTGQEVEAAKTLGASGARVIFSHIFPHTASYILAQLVFFAPSAILAEAGLSFLGLGDPSIPTWGQVLEYGFRTGAVFLGYWWWVVPPGLLIVITAVTFMFLALGLEPVVDPRLRGRRWWRY